MSTLVQSTQKTKLSVKTQIFAALGAIVAAIILPLYLYFTGQQPKMQAGKLKNFQMDFV